MLTILKFLSDLIQDVPIIHSAAVFPVVNLNKYRKKVKFPCACIYPGSALRNPSTFTARRLILPLSVSGKRPIKYTAFGFS